MLIIDKKKLDGMESNANQNDNYQIDKYRKCRKNWGRSKKKETNLFPFQAIDLSD